MMETRTSARPTSKRGLRTASAFCAALVAGSALGLHSTAAGATEFGTKNYNGIVSAQPPTGYPVSPAALDISSGPKPVTVTVVVTNLTGVDQTVPMDFSLHHVLTYQGVDVSDGQPGQPGLTFPIGSAKQTTQENYLAKQFGSFFVPASGQATISFSSTFSRCGYFQIDFNHTDAVLGKHLLASGFTRVLGCDFAPRLTPGYWKNHQAAAEAQLPQTLGNYTVSTFAQVTAIFNAMKCNAPANCMAAHLLAAQLDVSSGSAPCIGPVIADANAFLVGITYTGPGNYTLSAGQASQALSLESALDNYTDDSTSGTC